MYVYTYIYIYIYICVRLQGVHDVEGQAEDGEQRRDDGQVLEGRRG